MQLSVALSKLVAGRKNPRKVKPERDAHRRLVASIRSHGLIEPLVVRAAADPEHYAVLAGNRRLAALREVHRGEDPPIDCVLRDVEAGAGDAVSLAENFVREAMHPLDEADEFARLASVEGKGAEAVAAEFGVTERYVRQRMKLATLAGPVRSAYRDGVIDTSTAEAFTTVPADRQIQVWEQAGGQPRHADHVRNLIAHAWIDGAHALFDPSTLPESAVSRDLFGDRVIVERQAFMEAQAAALAAQQQAMQEDGWAEVVVGKREDLCDRLMAMSVPEREFDKRTARTLAAIERRKAKLEARFGEVGEDNDAAANEIQERYDALAAAEHKVVDDAPEHFSEETKAVATAFLILDPDGRVHRQHRVPRRRHAVTGSSDRADETSGGTGQRPTPPTSDDLRDRQLADTFTHQALAVREALLTNALARKRVLALILHEKVNSEALAVGREANGTTLHAERGDGFNSAAFDRLRTRRAELDPFAADHYVEGPAGYDRLAKMKEPKLDALIDLLVVDCVTAHMLRRTELVHRLAVELKVDLRQHWRPDSAWLAGYQKIQLAHLLAELHGPLYSPANESRKKSELVDAIAKLFTDAAEGNLEDKKLAERCNRWLPANMRETPNDERQIA